MSDTTKRRGAAVLLALAVAAGAGGVAAQDAPSVESYFPLEVGREWTYNLRITSAQQTRTIEYTTRVARVEQVEGLACAVLEDHSGERLLQVNWYAHDRAAQRVVQVQRQSGRAVSSYLRDDALGRVLLAEAGLKALPETTAWEWSSADGSSKGTVTLLKRGEKVRLRGLGELECILLLDEGEASVGDRRATIKRHVWLSPGIGCVQEHTTISAGGSVTESEATLIRHERSRGD
jgi:hypothetical protein